MFDAQIRPIIDPALNAQGRFLARLGFTANQVTLIGLALGLVAAGLIVAGATYWALVPLLLSRLADGLDGAVARARGGTDFGGYLDITCDFLFYTSLPLGKRWKHMKSPKGLPPSDWIQFTRKYAGILWPVFGTMPYVRLVVSALSSKLKSNNIQQTT